MLSIEEKEAEVLNSEEWKNFNSKLLGCVQGALAHTTQLLAMPHHEAITRVGLKGIFVTSLRNQLNMAGIGANKYYLHGQHKGFGKEIRDVIMKLLNPTNWLRAGVLDTRNFREGDTLMSAVICTVNHAQATLDEDFVKCWTEARLLRNEVNVTNSMVDTMEQIANRSAQVRKRFDALCESDD